AGTVASVLSDIAEIASETLELQQVFPRVAAAVRKVIPFDNMGVVRLVDGDRVVLHATTLEHEGCAGCDDCAESASLSAWSPRWRPHSGPTLRIGEARSELDPSYAMDAKVLAGGLRSALWEPFKSGEAFAGGVWLCSYAPYTYTSEHQAVLRPISALLGSAVEHWKIWD